MMAETTSLLTLLGLGALVVGALIARLPVATCTECPHCRAASIREAAKQRRLREDYQRRSAIPPRLWGRHDTPWRRRDTPGGRREDRDADDDERR